MKYYLHFQLDTVTAVFHEIRYTLLLQQHLAARKMPVVTVNSLQLTSKHHKIILKSPV